MIGLFLAPFALRSCIRDSRNGLLLGSEIDGKNFKALIKIRKISSLLLVLNFMACIQAQSPENTVKEKVESVVELEVMPAAHLEKEIPELLANRSVGMVVNQTSRGKSEHIVDFLLGRGVAIKKIFAPEHGFRGNADAGEQVADGKDMKTGLPIISLYGKNKKPSPEQLSGLDLVVFDIQDVGARFYTYLSTMHYVMEACAENNIPFIVLDRPNPHGNYVDGPILESEYRSFVGMHNIPIIHGMTLGELALMIAGEAWLDTDNKLDLQVVKCQNYTHQSPYHLPIAPSPNLPNMRSIYWYPSLCFFEGTMVSVGRGTKSQFQIVGYPEMKGGNISFTPESMAGAKYPKHEGLLCRGYGMPMQGQAKAIDWEPLWMMYKNCPDKENFFNEGNFFEKLAGTKRLREALVQKRSVEEWKESYAEELTRFKELRKKYLLYPDFE